MLFTYISVSCVDIDQAGDPIHSEALETFLGLCDGVRGFGLLAMLYQAREELETCQSKPQDVLLDDRLDEFQKLNNTLMHVWAATGAELGKELPNLHQESLVLLHFDL